MNFNHFIPNIFYNNIKLILEKSTFSRGISSIAISEGYGIMKVKDVNEYYHDMDFTDPKEAKIDDGKGSTCVIIIMDCLFLQLTTESEFIIRLQANPTVYLTGLTFSKCKVQKHLINLNSKSTSITHICCSQLDKIGSSDALFLYSETHENSFLKMVYSTITGTNEWRENVNRIFYLHGTCSLKIQCVNISNFILSNSDNHQIIDFTSPSCLNMVMNTLQNLDSR